MTKPPSACSVRLLGASKKNLESSGAASDVVAKNNASVIINNAKMHFKSLVLMFIFIFYSNNRINRRGVARYALSLNAQNI